MPTKRKNTVDIFPIEPRNVSNQKQESDEIIKRYIYTNNLKKLFFFY